MAYTYDDIGATIQSYYDKPQTIFTKLTSNEYDTDSFFNVISNSKDVKIIRNADGSIRQILNTLPLAISTSGGITNSITNSNTGGAVLDGIFANIPSFSDLTQSAKATIQAGLAAAGSSVPGLIAFATSVGQAVAAAAVGAQLGKTVDSVLYNTFPDYFDSHGMGSLNPETWRQIVQEAEPGITTTLFNILFVYDPIRDTIQPFIDEVAAAYIAQYLTDNDFWGGRGVPAPTPQVPLPTVNQIELPFAVSTDELNFTNNYPAIQSRWGVSSMTHTADVYSALFVGDKRDNSDLYYLVLSSTQPFSVQWYLGNTVQNANSLRLTMGGKTFYYTQINYSTSRRHLGFSGTYPPVTNIIGYATSPSDEDYKNYAYNVLYGSSLVNLPGVDTQTGATLPSLPKGRTDIADEVLGRLREQFPTTYVDERINAKVLQEDGTTTEYGYVAIPWVDALTRDDAVPVTLEDVGQLDPALNPYLPSWFLDLFSKISVRDAEQTDSSDTGEGDTPIPPTPGGEASSLFKVYNPSNTQLSNFGAWLWSSGFDIDQFKRLFTDPMQAIIGLHKVFVTPTAPTSQNIKVGYIDSGCPAPVVSKQYETFSCGKINLSEYFGNCLDYAPFCSLSAFLPFVGFVNLDIADCMRGVIEVKYSVDVFTGAVLAEIIVTRDLYGGVLYSFSGNCAVQYPITSGSYANMIASGIGVVGAIAGTIASDGALAPVLASSAGKMLTTKTQVSHGGGLSPNSAAMGGKIPYLIIQRPQSAVADTMPQLQGKPSNTSTILSSCSGFVQCKALHLDGVTATKNELSEIENLLQDGVII